MMQITNPFQLKRIQIKKVKNWKKMEVEIKQQNYIMIF